MNRLWKIVLPLLVLALFAGVGILGCGGVDPEPKQEGFDASAIDAEVAAEGEADVQEPLPGEESVPAPEGEPTTSEGP